MGCRSFWFDQPRKRLYQVGLWLMLCVVSSYSAAAIEVYDFESETDRLRYQSFIEELRCPKCQNQNLAGSDSPIAADLRRELYRMLEDGKSDKEIVDFMVARYGDYVLYRPQVKSNTLLLWGLPAGLFIVGLGAVLLILRSRSRTLQAEVASSDESERLQQLLTRAAERRSNPSDSSQR